MSSHFKQPNWPNQNTNPALPSFQVSYHPHPPTHYNHHQPRNHNRRGRGGGSTSFNNHRPASTGGGGYVRPRSNSIGVTRPKQDPNSSIKTNIRPRPATPIRLQRYDNYKSVLSSVEPNNNNTSSIISKTTSENFQHQQKIIQNQKKIIPEVVDQQQQHICELYSDTLDQCFDKTGVYVCKSYGPRCYIIQKVIKNSQLPNFLKYSSMHGFQRKTKTFIFWQKWVTKHKKSIFFIFYQNFATSDDFSKFHSAFGMLKHIPL